MQYIIDLQQYNIKEGSLSKPPYTLDQYSIAKANGDGIQAAVAYASENGYSEAILPRGEYSVCYEYKGAGAAPIIVIPSNLIINLNGSIIDVIFDSDNKSPYDSSSAKPYLLRGIVFQFHNSRNSSLINGELKGDIYNRSFLNAEEKKVEYTTGVKQWYGCLNIKVDGLSTHGFMADGISGSTRAFPDDVADKPQAASPGYMGDNGGVVTLNRDGCYYSPIIEINRTALAELHPLFPNILQMGTAGGYTRIPSFGENLFEVILYKNDGSFSRRVRTSYLGYILLLTYEDKLRIQYFNEKVGLESLPIPHDPFGFQLLGMSSSNFEIVNCTIHNNHRGGIANVCDFTRIHKNTIYHNGMDSSIGAPIFPDATRYQINCEDSYSKNVTIENNNLFSGVFPMLLGVNKVTVKGNCIGWHEFPAISIFNCQDVLIENNLIEGCGGLWVRRQLDKGGLKRHIKFKNNRVSCQIRGIQISYQDSELPEGQVKDNPIVDIEDNLFVCSGIEVKDSPNTNIKGNTFYINHHSVYSGIMAHDIGSFCDNKIYDTQGSLSGHRIFNIGRSYNNYFEGLTINGYAGIAKYIKFARGLYKSCVFNGVSTTGGHNDAYDYLYEDSTFDDCTVATPCSREPLADYKSHTRFANCQFKIKDKVPISSYARNGGVPNIDIDSCNIEYSKDSILPVLIQGYTWNEAQNYVVQMTNIRYKWCR